MRKEITMLERSAILGLTILFVLVLAAATPMSALPAPALQETATPGGEVTMEVTMALVTATTSGSATPGMVPVTGGNPPMSTLIITALLVILGVAIIFGGVALMRRPTR
jgi:hypothetical protein